jgi:uncharacterized protein YutE (UPF0331/DUF86 family)
MKKYLVESSNIKSIAYDIEFKLLVVTFKNRLSYSYKDIDPETVCNVLFADSVGSAFHKFIVKIHDATKLENDEK